MKIVLSFLLSIFFSVGCLAQHENTLTLQPKIGLDYSKLNPKGGESSSFATHFVGGVEGQYDFSDKMGIALGVLYARQGAKYKSIPLGAIKDSRFSSDRRTDLDYLLVPVTINMYATHNFALKLGPQMGFLVKARKSNYGSFTQKYYDGTWHNVPIGGKMKDITSDCNKFDLALSLGLSYEWKNIVLDGRFAYSFTHVQKDEAVGEQNMALYLTLGYRFDIFGSSK